MPLITCPDCGKQVSDQADHCIHCGCPLNTPQKIASPTGSQQRPPVRPVTQSGSNNNTVLIALICVLVAVIVGIGTFLIIKVVNNNSSASNNAAQIATAANITYTSYTAKELEDDLEQNAISAQEKYKGKNVEVTGELRGMDSDGKYFTIASGEFELIGIHCYIQNPAQVEQMKQFKVGDAITVRGNIDDMGEVMGYSLILDSSSGISKPAEKVEVKKEDKSHHSEEAKAAAPIDDGQVYSKGYSNTDYFIHNGSPRTLSEARAKLRFSDEEICRVYIPSGQHKGIHYRIVIGPYSSREAADEAAWNFYGGEAYELLSGKQMRKSSPVFMS